jgi:Bax protein
MPKEKTGARKASRWLSVGSSVVAILAVGPLLLSGLAGGGNAPSGSPFSLTVPVSFNVPVLRFAPATPVEPTLAEQAGRQRWDSRGLLGLFVDNNYTEPAIRSGAKAVPRLMLASLPHDIGQVDDIAVRKAVFVKAMLPLILLANERIEQDRTRLLQLHEQLTAGGALAPRDRLWLTELAARYSRPVSGGTASTPDEATVPADTASLLRQVDVVPPSLALAQAAEESGWGTSRFARNGNALFGQLTWSASQTGIVPRNRRQGETHRFRSFVNLKDCVDAYIHNLNTHRAYRDFRRERASLRRAGKPLDGLVLASGLVRYSERGPDYVRTLRTMIRSNGLTDFDDAALLVETAAGAD